MHEWIDTYDGKCSLRLDAANRNIDRQDMLEHFQNRFETVKPGVADTDDDDVTPQPKTMHAQTCLT